MLKSNAADLAVLDELYEAGALKTVVDSRFPLERLADAWQRSISGRAVGKVIVDVCADGSGAR
jgi:NADPH:quinone reductase-like Zn-dependent oxidoreductase